MRGIITVCSGKGGVGKTTSAQAIAGGLKVLGSAPDALLDLDYGASLTRAYGYPPSSPFSEALLDGRVAFEASLHDTDEGVSLIPADASLSMVEKERMVRWRDRLRSLGTSRLLVIDTSDDILSAPVASAILAADILAIPVPLSRIAYERTFPEIAGLLRSFQHEPEIVWFGTAVDVRTSAARHVLKSIADDGIELAALIPKGVAIEEAGLAGVSVVHTEPRSKTALAYMELSRVIYARLRRLNGVVPEVKYRELRPIATEAIAVNG